MLSLLVEILIEREEAWVDKEEFKVKYKTVQMHLSASQGKQGNLMVSEWSIPRHVISAAKTCPHPHHRSCCSNYLA